MELKQLEYFITCADTGSFRKAAQVLFTSQSNVSKVIQNLEHELGSNLFNRSQTGVTLTDKGANIYEYAKTTLESARRIMRFSNNAESKHLNILTNHSSWMAATFRQYYQACSNDTTIYSVLTASTPDIIETMAKGETHIGFVYITEQHLSNLQTQLTKNHLAFATLARTGAMLHYGNNQGCRLSDSKQLPLIQSYEDDFALIKSYWNTRQTGDVQEPAFAVKVVTNSDQLMMEMLEHTDICNISCGFSQTSGIDRHFHADSLFNEEAPVLFGFICRSDQSLRQEALDFLRFIKRQLSENAQ